MEGLRKAPVRLASAIGCVEVAFSETEELKGYDRDSTVQSWALNGFFTPGTNHVVSFPTLLQHSHIN